VPNCQHVETLALAPGIALSTCAQRCWEDQASLPASVESGVYVFAAVAVFSVFGILFYFYVLFIYLFYVYGFVYVRNVFVEV